MTDTATKAPPAWMKREPLSREGTATQLATLAQAARDAARGIADRDVAAGLGDRAAIIESGARTLRGQIGLQPRVAEMLADYGSTRLACARTTTAPAERAAYMDDAHTFREAVRHLKE